MNKLTLHMVLEAMRKKEKGVYCCNLHKWYFPEFTYKQVYSKLQSLVKCGAVIKTPLSLYMLSGAARSK